MPSEIKPSRLSARRLHGNIYIGGSFTTVGSIVASSIAKWDGTVWSTLGTGINGSVYALALSGNDLYAGGLFFMAGGVSVSYIAKWNGTTWSAPVGGMNNSVRSLTVSGNDLYAGGDFTSAGGVSASRIAKFNGTSWSGFGSGVNNTVSAIAVIGNDVYAAGTFTTAGGASANRIAKWNGSAWSALGSGVKNPINAVAVSGANIYVGGSFSIAGCHASSRFARYFNQSFVGGGTDNEWSTAANWNIGTVPASNTDVTIANANVSVATNDAAIRDLRIDEGRVLTVAADRTLTINGNLNLLGTITGEGIVIVTTCNPSAVSRAVTAGYIQTALVRCVNNSGDFNFPVGTANGYSPVNLSDITGTGNVSIKSNQGAYSNPVTDLPVNRLSRWWRINNSDGGIVSADVTFSYLQSDVVGSETNYKAYRIAEGAATQVLSSIDAVNNTLTASNVTQFSNWTLAPLATTAASVSVSGRVLTSTGRGIRNVVVTMTDLQGNERTAQSTAFGYYRFDDVAAGKMVTLSAKARRFRFVQSSIVRTTNESISDADFISEQ